MNVSYKNKNVLVLGYGISGQSATKFLMKLGSNVIIYDDKKKESLNGVLIHNQVSDELLANIDLLILSPGVDPSHPLIIKAKAFKIEIKSELELGLEHVHTKKIAITGTNGKSSVTKLLSKMLNDQGIQSLALGNIGLPITSCIEELKHKIAVIEVSSFQIDSLSQKHFDLALILNITPDHLDRYKNLDAYRCSKLRLNSLLYEGSCIYLPDTEKIERSKSTEVKYYNQELSDEEREALSSINTICAGYQNASAAICLGKELKLNFEKMLESIETFSGLNHRREWVCKIGGVDFINDSKATNLEAVMFALEEVKSEVIMIMGGVDKGFDFKALKKYFQSKVKKVYVIGESRGKIQRALEPDFFVYKCESLKEATLRAFLENENKCPILFSPGCSSYDMFTNFEERGEEFKLCARSIQEVKL